MRSHLVNKDALPGKVYLKCLAKSIGLTGAATDGHSYFKVCIEQCLSGAHLYVWRPGQHCRRRGHQCTDSTQLEEDTEQMGRGESLSLSKILFPLCLLFLILPNTWTVLVAVHDMMHRVPAIVEQKCLDASPVTWWTTEVKTWYSLPGLWSFVKLLWLSR